MSLHLKHFPPQRYESGSRASETHRRPMAIEERIKRKLNKMKPCKTQLDNEQLLLSLESGGCFVDQHANQNKSFTIDCPGCKMALVLLFR